MSNYVRQMGKLTATRNHRLVHFLYRFNQYIDKVMDGKEADPSIVQERFEKLKDVRK